jgi:hypothetical protein
VALAGGFEVAIGRSALNLSNPDKQLIFN